MQWRKAVAGEAGIVRFEAELLPGDEAAAVQQLKRRGIPVGMAGDGINDARAPTAADVRFAMVAGWDVAMQTADITLIRSDLSACELIGTSHSIRHSGVAQRL